jgi:hypothetical protein
MRTPEFGQKNGRLVGVSPNKASWWLKTHLEKYESQWEG